MDRSYSKIRSKRGMISKGVLIFCMGFLFLIQHLCAAQVTASVLEPSSHRDQRLVTVHFVKKPLADVLHELARKVRVGISYQTKVMPDKKVTYKARKTSIYTVLDAVLEGTELYAALSESRKVIFIKKKSEQKVIHENTITGTVTDAGTGETLPGVNILVIGTSVGTSTNAKGEYELNVESLQDTLRFSYIGYETRKIPLNGRTTVNITLKSTTTGLDEMIVTGYGQESRADLSGSVSTVDSVAIADVPAQNAESVLQGRAAGVQVTSASGNPGAGFSIQIRGNGSINAGTDPLYIVDGVEVNSANQSGLTESSPLNKIDPDDIASIQVLKDAASAAIYGAQAANGVVVITTKRGTQGATKISAKVERGIRKNINTYNTVNSQEYLQYYQDALDLSDQGTLDFGNSFGYAFAGTPYSSIEDFPTYDWQDNDVYTTGYHQGYSITASGGDAKTRFYLSGSYDKTQGTIQGSNFDRFAFRTNLDHQVNNKLSAKVNINLANTNQFGLCQSGNSINCPVSNSIFQPPVAPAFLPNGEYNPNTLFGATSNEALLLDKETRNVSDVSIFGNVSATYDFTDWLSLRGLFGLDWKTGSDKQFRPPVLAPSDNGSIYNNTRDTYNFTTNAVLSFNHTFDEKHNLNGFVATEYRRDYNTTSGATGIGLSNDLLNVLDAAATASSVGGYNTEYRVASYFSNIKYNYDHRYYLSLTGRYDGSSRFGVDNRWGFFPSIAVAWRIADEDFFNADFINTLKLKASYGVTGNAAINNFQSRGTYGVDGTYLGQNGLSPTRLANPELTWEESREFNIGVDYGFFNNRINGSVEAYRRNSANLLLNRPLPLDSGFGSVTQNVGTVRNEGIEFNIETVNIQQGDFRWSTSLNLTVQTNTVTKLNAGQEQLNSGTTPIAVGHSIRAWWVPEWAGVSPADGRPIWYDKNGNLTFTPTLEDNKFFDGGDQDLFGGFGTTLSYKGVSLNALFQGSYGQTGEPASLVTFLRTPTFRGVVDKSVLRSWNQPGQITDLPRPVSGDAPDGSANWRGLGAGTGALYNASYIRLKSVTLNYDFPVSLTGKLNLQGLRLYFSAYNLHTWSNWPSINPEIVNNNNYANYPPALQVNGGIKIDF